MELLSVHAVNIIQYLTVKNIFFLLQDYCQSLEHALADLRQKLRNQTAELNSLKTELSQVTYYRNENQHLCEHLQQQQTNVDQLTKVWFR